MATGPAFVAVVVLLGFAAFYVANSIHKIEEGK
jgi:hypothetical protein